MPGETKPEFAATTVGIEEGFPPTTVPTIYADGIANAAPSPYLVKFYLFQSDPEQTGKPSYKNQVVAQVVMSMPGFVQASLFFEKALKQFVDRGTIKPELIEEVRKIEGIVSRGG